MANERRGWQIFGGVVIPPLCFLVAAMMGADMGPDVRRANWSVYLHLLLQRSVSVAFLPFVLLASGATALRLIAPARAAAARWARPALQVGIAISIVYIVVMAVSWLWLPLLFGGVPILGLWLLHVLLRRRFSARVTALAQAAVIIAGSALTVATGDEGMPFLVGLGILAMGPAWSLLAFGLALRSLPPRAGGWLGGGLWASYAASWWPAIEQARAYYWTLPTSKGCFVVTAAAQGHPRVVGSVGVAGRRVNRQLIVLKAAEIRLAQVAPRLHRRLRRAYDRIGPRIARRIDRAWKADFVYILLKPPEWAVRITLPRVVRRRAR